MVTFNAQASQQLPDYNAGNKEIVQPCEIKTFGLWSGKDFNFSKGSLRQLH